MTEEVKRWDVWNDDLRKTPHTGTRINRDDSYWTVVVLASDFDSYRERAEARIANMERDYGLLRELASEMEFARDAAMARAEAAEKEITRLAALLERAQSRLELFGTDGAGNRVLLSESCDGIASRNETIKLLDERISRLVGSLHRARLELTGMTEQASKEFHRIAIASAVEIINAALAATKGAKP